MSKSKNIVVFCGASTPTNTKIYNCFKSLGEVIALKKHTLVYGGGGKGAMGILAKAALGYKGEVTGVVPQCYANEEAFDSPNYKHIEADSLDERKRYMNKVASMFILAPGGSGSLDEFFWALSTHDLKDDLAHHTAPIHVLNINGIYNSLYQQLCTLVAEGFMSKKSFDKVTFHNSVGELSEYL